MFSVSMNLLLILKNIVQCDVKHIMMLPIKTITSVGLDLHYHSSTYWTYCNTSDYVCLNLPNCRYSIYGQIKKKWLLCFNLCVGFVMQLLLYINILKSV